MSRWFRMYEELLDDPKVQRLPAHLFRAWVNILALTSRHGGIIPSAEDCAFALRETVDAVSASLNALETAALIKRKNGKLVPNGWDKRQYKSDTSSDRVKRFRERHSNGKETPSESDAETETDIRTPVPIGTSPPDEIRLAFDGWNDLALRCALPKAERLTEPRKRSLAMRLRECGGIEGWRAALAKVEQSPLCLGQVPGRNGSAPWRANFDFMLQPSSFLKLIEGTYDGTGPPDPSAAGMAASRQFAEALDARKCQSQPQPQPISSSALPPPSALPGSLVKRFGT